MRSSLSILAGRGGRFLRNASTLFAITILGASAAMAEPEAAGEAGLKLPDLSQVLFLGVDGHRLLSLGIVFCVLGLGFGLAIYMRLKNLPVHRAMREVSELIYETCKTYLFTQGKFLGLLWVFIAVVIVLYFGFLSPVPGKPISTTLPIILLFSIVGIVGYPRQHICQLPHRLRQPSRKALRHISNPVGSRHEHWHDAHQC